MEVTNKTSFSIIAFCFDTSVGYGEDVVIQSNECKDVKGPYLGTTKEGKCYIQIDGAIVCHEGPDSEVGFQVEQGRSLVLSRSETQGVTVRHHLDNVEECISKWRARKA